jgi:hypothetical protein
LQVINNCISKELQDYFEAITLGKVNDIEIDPIVEFKAKYEPTAFAKNSKPISFKHILKSSAELSDHLINFSKIPQAVFPSLHDILYARIFLTIPYETNMKHHAPHVDLTTPHTSLIYYINDSDGDTLFFDDNDNIINSVTPTKGTAVLFDGLVLHAAGIPTKGPRCIVNYNLI